MREFGPSSLSLTGSLLIAHPGLLDPNFRRAVLFLSSQDDEEGAFGLILNRPSGRTVGDVLPDRDMGPLSRVPVLIGGPVSRDQLIFASFHPLAGTKRLECRHHIAIEEAEELLRDDTVTVRGFVGYSGWSKGQLEAELQQKAWLVAQAEASILDLDRTETLWRDLTSAFSPWLRLMAEAPEDPSRN